MSTQQPITTSKFLFLTILMLSSFGQVSSDLYLPSLPAIAEGLHVEINAAQFSITIYMLGFGVSQLFYGPLSDGLGRRIPLLIGLALSVVGSIMCMLAPNIEILIAGRLIQGLGTGAGAALARPMVVDLFSGKELARYASYFAVVGTTLLAFAPTIGGYLQHFIGWRACFAFLLIYGSYLLYRVIFKVPETNEHRHPDNLQTKTIAQNFWILLKSPVFMRHSICSCVAYGALLSWLTSGPVVLQEVVGLTPVQFGWLTVVTGIAFMSGALLNSRIVDRIGIQPMLQIGLFLMLLAGLLMLGLFLAGFINAYVIVGPVVVMFLGASMVFPNTFAGGFPAFAHIAGITGALFGAMRMLGGALASGLIASVQETNQLPLAIAIIICTSLAWVAYLLLRQPEAAS
ncbi:MAG: Bcr/CflA family drug resistance efflux transporter [Legionellales bacterium]|nr:Bcr/CflA family drug resistance efflux transporter [Legionellales bacterium]|tara:strand:- start:2513 stop:3715 length:1203 start_codon:yes stop_codon:yes gene_type:complete